MITKTNIIDAYLFLRENNHSIPTEVLEFIKDASLEKLEKINAEESKILTDAQVEKAQIMLSSSFTWESCAERFDISVDDLKTAIREYSASRAKLEVTSFLNYCALLQSSVLSEF